MPKKGMTIIEVKEKKIQLEKDILVLLKKYESDTGVYVNYMNLERKRNKDEGRLDEPETASSKRSKPKELVNVNVDMELDLIY